VLSRNELVGLRSGCYQKDNNGNPTSLIFDVEKCIPKQDSSKLDPSTVIIIFSIVLGVVIFALIISIIVLVLPKLRKKSNEENIINN